MRPTFPVPRPDGLTCTETVGKNRVYMTLTEPTEAARAFVTALAEALDAWRASTTDRPIASRGVPVTSWDLGALGRVTFRVPLFSYDLGDGCRAHLGVTGPDAWPLAEWIAGRVREVAQ